MYYGIKKYPYNSFDSSDDVCTQLYGSDAYTPTNVEFNELIDNTTVEFATVGPEYNGVSTPTADCVIFTAKDGVTKLILPLAGIYENYTFYKGWINSIFWSKGKVGYCWMNTHSIKGRTGINVQDAYMVLINGW